MKIKQKYFLILTSIFYSVPFLAFAEIGIPCGKGGDMCNFNDIFILINNLIKFFLSNILLPIIIVFILYIGFLLLTSGGKPDARSKAKTIAKNILIGLAMILGAWLIVFTIFKAFGYDTSYGRAGLSEKKIDWQVDNNFNVKDLNQYKDPSSSNPVATNENTQYKSSISVNRTNPQSARVTVIITPKAVQIMPIMVSCLASDIAERSNTESNILLGSDTVSLNIKTRADVDYNCIIENTVGTLNGSFVIKK